MYDHSKNWTHYLTRPFNLFGASLWHLWYFSEQTREMFGTDMPGVLFIEAREKVVRHYRTQEQLYHFRQAMREVVLNRPEYCLVSLERGNALNQKAEEALFSGPSTFSSLQEAVNFFTTMSIYSTTLPFFTLVYLEESRREDSKLSLLSKQLRSTSYYPKILENIVEPWARQALPWSIFCVCLQRVSG